MARPGSLSSNSMTWLGLMCWVAVNPLRAAETRATRSARETAAAGGAADFAAGEVGVDGVGEAAGEHGLVAAVDAQGVPDHLLADLGAVFDLADAGFEVGRHGWSPGARGQTADSPTI